MHQSILNGCLTDWQKLSGLRLEEDQEEIVLKNRENATLGLFPDSISPFAIQKFADDYLVRKSYDN